jgi:hypothetical protein
LINMFVVVIFGIFIDDKISWVKIITNRISQKKYVIFIPGFSE